MEEVLSPSHQLEFPSENSQKRQQPNKKEGEVFEVDPNNEDEQDYTDESDKTMRIFYANNQAPLADPVTNSKNGKQDEGTTVPRQIQTGTEKVKFCTNKIKSTRYNIFTFVPVSLALQFSRVVNVFYLFNGILQFIPSISTSNPFVSYISLYVVVALGMIREAIVDYQRSKQDKLTNSQKTLKYCPTEGNFVSVAWQELGVGDLIWVKENEKVAADVVVLASSESNGSLYCSTATLDGERTLKPRQAVIQTQRLYENNSEDTTNDQLGAFVKNLEHLEVRCPQPCKNLNVLNAKLRLIPLSQQQILAEGDADQCNRRQSMASLISQRGAGDKNNSKPDSNSQLNVPYREDSGCFAKRNSISMGHTFFIDSNQAILRGSLLQNTQWVIGLVTYSGKETKIVLNQGKYHFKQPTTETAINRILIFQVCLLLLLVLLMGLLNYHFTTSHIGSLYLFQALSQIKLFSFKAALSYYLLSNQLVPIGLIVAIEMGKLCQRALIEADVEMYSEKTGQMCKCLNYAMHEDLGIIQHVFTDKTGTLTANILTFRGASVANKCFSGNSEDEVLEKINDYQNHQDYEEVLETERKYEKPSIIPKYSSVQTKTKHLDILDNAHYNQNTHNFYNEKAPSSKSYAEAMHNFLLTICLCNDVIVVEEKPNKQDVHSRSHTDQDNQSQFQQESQQQQKKEYHGQSTDEVTLIKAAQRLGYTMLDRHFDIIKLEIRDPTNSDKVEQLQYKILQKFDFSSDRKRMSVVVLMPDGSLMVFTKGADSMIFSLLDQSCEQPFLNQTKRDVNKFSCEGLRTLAMAARPISHSRYNEWLTQYNQLITRTHSNASSTSNLEQRKQVLQREIEGDQVLLGCSALADELQDDVPAVISEMRAAGMKVWVLTGDKLETAENIGYSCSLFAQETNQFRITEATLEDVQLKMNNIESYISGGNLDNAHIASNDWFTKAGTVASAIQDNSSSNMSSMDVAAAAAQDEKKKQSLMMVQRLRSATAVSGWSGQTNKEHVCGLVVEGHSFTTILSNDDLKQQFLSIAKKSQAIVICRASPSQKANVVKMVRETMKNKSLTTIAVGDGSNDVAMIQAAHVGIGIFGSEGSEAASNADYAIGEFKHLSRLIFWQGHNVSQKMAVHINLFMFKSVIYAVIPLWYATHNGFSGTNPWMDLFGQFYDVIITNFDIVPWLMWDTQFPMGCKDVTLLAIMPLIYKEHRDEHQFTALSFFKWQLFCYYASAVALLFPIAAFQFGIDSNGRSHDMIPLLMSVYAIIVLTHDFQVLIYTKSMTIIQGGLILLNLLMFFPVIVMLNQVVPVDQQFMNVADTLSQQALWLTIFCALVIINLPFYVATKTVTLFTPTLADQARNYIVSAEKQNRSATNMNDPQHGETGNTGQDRAMLMAMTLPQSERMRMLSWQSGVAPPNVNISNKVANAADYKANNYYEDDNRNRSPNTKGRAVSAAITAKEESKDNDNHHYHSTIVSKLL